MLQILKTAATVHPRQPRRHLHITGENLAKARRGARERAFLAAHWVCNALTLTNPTVRLAARTFGVSVPMVTAMVTKLQAVTVATPATIDAVWACMSAADRDQFCRDHLADLWERFDRATAA
jgi:hypothetical protein